MASGGHIGVLLVSRGGHGLDHTWRWRARGGELLDPADMETRHLMNVIIMVWNHVVPEGMKTHEEFIHYKFGPEHTPEYMRQAVRIMFNELSRRDLSVVSGPTKDRWNVIKSWLTQSEFAEQYGLTETRSITHVQTD